MKRIRTNKDKIRVKKNYITAKNKIITQKNKIRKRKYFMTKKYNSLIGKNKIKKWKGQIHDKEGPGQNVNRTSSKLRVT